MSFVNLNFVTVSEPISEKNRIFENCDIHFDGNITEGGLTFRNCTISNVSASVNNCIFENCRIDCENLTNCKLINCSAISVYDGIIKNCKFTMPSIISASRCTISNCEFSNITINGTDECGLLLAEDTSISGCYFHDIRLTGGCYLISAFGDCCVTNCGFTDCSTSRKDLKVIYCEDAVGKHFKETVTYDIIDDSCAGLDDIQLIDN